MGQTSSISTVMVGVKRDLSGQTMEMKEEIQSRLNQPASYSISAWSILITALLRAAKTISSHYSTHTEGHR